MRMESLFYLTTIICNAVMHAWLSGLCYYGTGADIMWPQTILT